MLKQAEIERQRIETLASAERQRSITEAEGRASAIRAQGEAEAEIIFKKGEAEAKAMNIKAEAFQEYNQAAVIDKLFTGLPDVVRALAEPLSKIDKVTIVSTGNGDAAGAYKLTAASAGQENLVFASVPAGPQGPAEDAKWSRGNGHEHERKASLPLDSCGGGIRPCVPPFLGEHGLRAWQGCCADSHFSAGPREDRGGNARRAPLTLIQPAGPPGAFGCHGIVLSGSHHWFMKGDSSWDF